MALPDDFHTECLYAPGEQFVHELVSIDREAGRIVGLTDTTRLGPLVDAQQVRPNHPRHVPGAVMIQITGTLGNLHLVYVLGLKPSEGWTGFGVHIKDARFPSLGKIGPPMQVELTATRLRRFRGRHFATYQYRFSQEGRDLYLSEQTAVWFQGEIGALG